MPCARSRSNSAASFAVCGLKATASAAEIACIASNCPAIRCRSGHSQTAIRLVSATPDRQRQGHAEHEHYCQQHDLEPGMQPVLPLVPPHHIDIVRARLALADH